MMNQNVFEVALRYAVNAHRGQFDKVGNPLILHPIRVAENVTGSDFKAVAVLHDILEDTETSVSKLRAKFGDKITDAVRALTKIKGDPYRLYLNTVLGNPIASVVKLADMQDNSSPERIQNLPIKLQLRLINKYARGRHYLLTREWHGSTPLDQLIKDGYK